MDLQLEGKTALVTASTGGIGKAIAEELLKEGASVIIHGSRDESAENVVEEFKSKYPHVKGVGADLSKPDGCKKIIDAINEPVDILINNFGIYEVVDFFQTTDELWSSYFESNVLTVVTLSRHFLKPMLDRNWGRVIFISSESGLNIPEDMIHYGFTKTAQLSIMRGLAKLTKGSKVTVNALLPGPTLTEGVEEFIEKIAREKKIDKQEIIDDFVKENRPSSLTQRFAQVDEVAHMAAFLCSPLASLTNGSAVKVEGGIVDQIM